MVALQVGRTSFLGCRPPHLGKRKLTHESEQTHTQRVKMLEIYYLLLVIFLVFSLPYLYGLPDVYRFWKPLWRILRHDEDPKVGLVAKDPQACKTVLSHVNCGGRERYRSQYISTTASYAVAQHSKAKAETRE